MRVLGIDEAGRGCVLGDLVIAGFVADDPCEVTLRTAGANDSKAVSAKRRQVARQALQSLGSVEIRRISPREIDQANLNQLEEAAIVQIITCVRPDVVQIDALGHPSTLPALMRRLRAQLPSDLSPQWTIEPKADANFAAVGAASIFAKTTRDELLDGWRPEFGEFGSGYPSDPKTRAWLVAWAETRKPWPSFVRTRWATISELTQNKLI